LEGTADGIVVHDKRGGIFPSPSTASDCCGPAVGHDAFDLRAAIHLGKGIIERDVESTVPDKSTELILYCGGGYRSALAADVLQNMGYTNVWSMAGGWKVWKESGGPVE